MGTERIPPLPDTGYGVTNSGSSRRNLIVNGDMLINQRFPAAGSGMTSDGSSPQWFNDRWAITAPAGEQFIYHKQINTFSTGLPGFSYSMLMNPPAGHTVSFPCYYAQAIESAKIQEIAGL